MGVLYLFSERRPIVYHGKEQNQASILNAAFSVQGAILLSSCNSF